VHEVFDHLLNRLGPAMASPVMVLGDGRWTVTEQLRRRGASVETVGGDWPSIQLPRRFDLAIVEPRSDSDAVAALHCAVQHLEPGGCVLLAPGPDDSLAARFDLVAVAEALPDGVRVALWRRTDRRTIHDVVFAARSRINRTSANDLAARLRSSDPPTVIDTRTATDRHRFGVIAGSIHVPRTVVEWHLDPANGYRHPSVSSLDQPLVVVCNGGYSSALAAVSLLDLGFTDVADLVGGVRAWIGAGHPVVAADHSHLDI
jgi:rhodanese-related sulfurtransferase